MLRNLCALYLHKIMHFITFILSILIIIFVVNFFHYYKGKVFFLNFYFYFFSESRKRNTIGGSVIQLIKLFSLNVFSYVIFIYFYSCCYLGNYICTFTCTSVLKCFYIYCIYFFTNMQIACLLVQ